MTRFAIIHVTFDESAGPVLNLIFKQNLQIPNAILQGVATTLFTMAIGVGEPTGEPQISIIPVNVTDIRGRTLIYSFGVEDASARGGQIIEAFMVFVRMSHDSHRDEDKLLRHSIPIIKILEKGVEARIKLGKDSQYNEYFENLAEALQKILLTDLYKTTEDDLSDLCTEKELAIVSDGGSIRAIHNLDLTAGLVTAVKAVHWHLETLGKFIVNNYGDEALLALPLEIHGHLDNPSSEMNLYVEAIESCFANVLTSGDGRTNILGRPLKRILWDLNLDQKRFPLDTPQKAADFLWWPSDLSTPYTFSADMLQESFELLSEYSHLFSSYSVFKISEYDPEKSNSGDHALASHADMIATHRAAGGLFLGLSQLSKAMTSGEELRDITIATFGSEMGQILILSWFPGYIMVGESNRGPGLLNILAEQIHTRLRGLHQDLAKEIQFS